MAAILPPSMGDKMKEANGVFGMVKFAASRSGSKFIIGREGWKGMVVNKLMYGCGAQLYGLKLNVMIWKCN